MPGFLTGFGLESPDPPAAAATDSHAKLDAVPDPPLDPPELLVGAIFSNVLGRRTKPKRRSQVKNLARRVCIFKARLRRNSRWRSMALAPDSGGPPVVVGSGSSGSSGSSTSPFSDKGPGSGFGAGSHLRVAPVAAVSVLVTARRGEVGSEVGGALGGPSLAGGAETGAWTSSCFFSWSTEGRVSRSASVRRNRD
jgi:hypothetical protein